MAFDRRSRRSWITIAAFVLVVVAVGGLIGVNTAPGAWYQGLNKPPFNPPNWLFGPVWFALYVMVGIAGARTFLRDPASPQMLLWIL
ncbi:MAG: TspO/MBR family protein, partial [Devosia sp.]